MRLIQYSFLVFILICCKPNISELQNVGKELVADSSKISDLQSTPPPSYYSGCTFIEVEGQLFFHGKGKHLQGYNDQIPFIELLNNDLILLKGKKFDNVVDSLLNIKSEARFKICELVNPENKFSKRNFEKLKNKLTLQNGFVWYRRTATPEEIGVICRNGADISNLCNFEFKYHRFSLRKDNVNLNLKYSYPVIFVDSVFNIPLSLFDDADPFYFHLDLNNRELGSTHRFLNKRSFRVNKKEFEVYKFTNAYNEPPLDGVGNYFFSPQIGMLILYSVNWGSFEKLVECPKINKEELDYLTFQILSDSKYLRDF